MTTLISLISKIFYGKFLLPVTLHLSDCLPYWSALINFALALFVMDTRWGTHPLSCSFSSVYPQSSNDLTRQKCLQNNYALFYVPGMENIRLRGTETCENDSFGDRWFVAGYMHLDVCFLGLSILSVVSMLVWKFLFPKRCANVFDHLQKYMDTKTDVPSDTTANVLQDIGERLHDAFMPEKRFVSAFLLYVGGKLALAVPLLLMQIFLITHCISPVRGELLPGSKDKLIYSHPMNFSWLTNVKEELLLAQSPKGYFPRDVYCNALTQEKYVVCEPVRCYLSNARAYEIALTIFVVYNVSASVIQMLHVLYLLLSSFWARKKVFNMLKRRATDATGKLVVPINLINDMADTLGVEGMLLIMLENSLQSLMRIPMKQFSKTVYARQLIDND